MEVRLPRHKKDMPRNLKNDYLSDRLNAQRILSSMSLFIPLALFLLYLITPHASDSGSSMIVINVSSAVIAIAALRFFLNWGKPRDNNYQLSSALLDFLSAAAILIAYALSYDVPISIALKSPTANIFFIYLTSRIVLFHGKIMLQTGAMAIGTWSALVALAMLEPEFAGRTSSYIDYLTSFKVLLGAEIERVLQFAIITAILYTFITLARYDAPTGFLRRAYFLQSSLKFFSQAKSKNSEPNYAMIEFRATDVSDTGRVYDRLFKRIPDIPSFQKIKFARLGRLSYQSAAARIEYSGTQKDLLKTVQTMHDELSDITMSDLGTKTPGFVVGATLLDLDLNYHDQLSHVDIAIRKAVKEGQRALVFDETLQSELMFKQNIQYAIKQGLEKDLFSVAYQPIIDLMTDKPIGFEALIRLKTQAGETLSPSVFVPVAETSGLIDDITDYMCDIIKRDAVEIRDMFIGSNIDPYININISPVQLKDVNRVTRALRRAQKSGVTINAEITESSILNEHRTDEKIKELKAAGFAVAIDDFGTGYSSIERLNTLDSMALKIDQSFVRNIEDEDQQAFTFLKAIVNLAQTTSNLVIVEGVETLAQKLLLMKMGVRYCQGYFYAKPMDVYDLKDHLTQRYNIIRLIQRRSGHIASF